MDEDEVRKEFMACLGASPDASKSLMAAGYSTIEEIAYVPFDELKDTTKLGTQLLVSFRSAAISRLDQIAMGNDDNLKDADS